MDKGLRMDLRAAYAKKQDAADEVAREHYRQFSELDPIFRRLAEVLSQPEIRPILWRLAEGSHKNGDHPELMQFTVARTQIRLELYTQDHRFYRIVQYVGQCDKKTSHYFCFEVFCSGAWGIHESSPRGKFYVLANSDHFTPSSLGSLPSSSFRDLVGHIEDALLNLANVLGINCEAFIP